MKRLSFALLTILFVPALPALAEKPTEKPAVFSGTISPGELTPTPEMWFYEQQMRTYQDPSLAVRRNAEVRAAYRQSRLESRKWFGFSNLRPTASSDPFHGDYSPGWTSNNSWNPSRWAGYGAAAVVIAPRTRTY
ncbi:MAG: hypothetical protein GXY83_11025 [Rhodopirellula sp.]|nr:hypothetical protein [Rhodopirellula sp.]